MNTIQLTHIAEPLRRFAVALDTLTLDPQNARDHPFKNLEAIKGSLAQFGQRMPCLHDLNNVVRIGNGRLEAARALGWKFIASMSTADLKPGELEALALIDNRTSELAEWDYAQVAALLSGDKTTDWKSLGWNTGDVANLLATQAPEGKDLTPAIADDVDAVTCPDCGFRQPRV